MRPAPVFHADLAEGPEDGEAWTVAAEDGTALRVATWPAGRDGTALIFPGRNEHVEKYGRTAADLGRRGFSSAVIDWRGQGHSSRAPLVGDAGHVETFADYQKDVAALLAAARAAELPEPFFLLAHSMGGAIGLRALIEGLPVRAAAFSAPMWGIEIAPHLRPLTYGLSALTRLGGLANAQIPVGRRESYLLWTGFEDNSLTTDRPMFDWMVAQARRDPRLALGRPTLRWLDAALAETRWLLRHPTKPEVPTYVGIATGETIVDNAAIRRLVDRWPAASAELYEGARHELMMERAEIRTRFLDAAEALFRAAS